MRDAPDTPTPKSRRGRYLALAALVPLAAAAAGALPLAFPPRVIASRDLMALAVGAENTGGFRLGQAATVRGDTALFTGLVDTPPAADSVGGARPALYVVLRVEDRWLVVRADPSVDCLDEARLATPDGARLLPSQFAGTLAPLPTTVARRVVAALNKRTPDLTDDGRDGDRWSRRQLLPVMLASEGGAAQRARCLVRRTHFAARDSAPADSVPARTAAAPRPPTTAGPGPEELLAVVRERGADVAIGWLDGVRAAAPDAPAVREAEVNAAGYALLREGMTDEALALLRWNAERHPASATAHDSLAEALERSGDAEQAAMESAQAIALLDADPTLGAAFREQVRRAAAERLVRLR